MLGVVGEESSNANSDQTREGPVAEQSFDLDSRNIIYQEFERMHQSELQSIPSLAKEAKILGADSAGDSSMESARGTLSEVTFSKKEEIRQGERALEMIRRGDSVLLQEKGRDPEVTKLHFGYAISLKGQAMEQGGTTFSLDGMGCIFVPNSSFAGKEIAINGKNFFTVTPGTPFGQQLLKNSLAEERKK